MTPVSLPIGLRLPGEAGIPALGWKMFSMQRTDAGEVFLPLGPELICSRIVLFMKRAVILRNKSFALA